MGDVYRTPVSNRAAARRNSVGTSIGSTPNSAARMLGDLAFREALKYGGKKVNEYLSGPSKKRKTNPPGKGSGAKRVQGQVGSSRAVVFKVGRKKVRPKKIVKVSRPLRAKINKVIEEKKIRGWYQVVQYGKLQLPNSNQQSVQNCRDPYHAENIYSSFSVMQFLHQASVLWNGKADSAAQNNLMINNVGTAYTAGPSDPNVQPGSVTKFSCNAKFTVINSYEKYYMKNNSERTLTTIIYVCIPKRAMMEYAVGVDNNNVSHGAQPQTFSDATFQWREALVQANKAGGNLGNITQNQLHTYPDNLPLFNRVFKCEKISVVLEPGQDYSFNLQGPRMLDIDASKYYEKINTVQGSVLLSVQKFSRSVFFITKADLVHQGTEFGFSGRLQDTNDNSPRVISIERTIHSVLSIPESVAMKVDSSGISAVPTSNLQNLNRQHQFFATTYTQAGVGAIRRVDEQNADDEILG